MSYSNISCNLTLRGGAVWTARWGHIPKVAGSNPVPATNLEDKLKQYLSEGRIPCEVRICGLVWKVRIVSAEVLEDIYEYRRQDDHLTVQGLTSASAQTIYLRKGMDPVWRTKVFCHELVHAIYYSIGSLGATEEQAELLSMPLMWLLDEGNWNGSCLQQDT